MRDTTSLRDDGAGGRGRSRSHRWWLVGLRFAVVVGLVCATQQWGWASTLAALLCAMFTAIIVWLPFLGKELPPTRIFLGRAFLAGTLVTASAGLILSGGIAGTALVLLLTATSPWLREAVRSRWPSVFGPLPEAAQKDVETAGVDSQDRPSHRSPDHSVDRFSDQPGVRGGVPAGERSGSAQVALPVLPEPLDLTDDELCLAWRQSFRVLENSHSGPAYLEVVRLRQAYLDEMQNRFPGGFETWLASGARAAGNPLPFLRAPGDATARRPPDSSIPGDDPPPVHRERD